MKILHYCLCALFTTAFLMSHRFKCTAEACGRSFPEPRRLARHQDVCQVWRQHCIEQRRQVLLLSRDEPESRSGVNSPNPKQRRLQVESDDDLCPTGTGHDSDLLGASELPVASNDGAAVAPSSREQMIHLVSRSHSSPVLKRKCSPSHEADLKIGIQWL